MKSAPKPSSVSIVVPAYNEEQNIVPAVESMISALSAAQIQEFQIIIVNDGSTDRTGILANGIASREPQVITIHNSGNKGMGYNFRKGIEKATGDYIGLLPGDNETLSKTMENIFKALGKADIIVPYTVNKEARPRHRRILSETYTVTFNTLFGMHMLYFNGPCFFKKELLNNVKMTTNGPSYMAELLVQLIRIQKRSYIETAMFISNYGNRRSSLLIPNRFVKNVAKIGFNILRLLGRVYVLAPLHNFFDPEIDFAR